MLGPWPLRLGRTCGALGPCDRRPAMLVLGTLLRLVAPILLHLSHCQPSTLMTGNRSVQVLPFEDVLTRSLCRPLEQLVDIVTEYPGEVEHIFSPSCVSLQRCMGCCGDERLQCIAVETANVTMQLMKINQAGKDSYTELSFTEHRRCDCRPRWKRLRPNRRKMKSRGRVKTRENSQELKCVLSRTGNCLQ